MIGGADPLKAKVTMQQLVFPMGEETPQEQIKSAGTYLLQASQTISSCEDLATLQKQLNSGHLSERQTLEIGDLAAIFQPSVVPLQRGESSVPILTNQGFHLLTVCEREDVGLTLPDREQIENQLANQQLSMMARRYMRDLRNDAVVELR
jgi:peptidyl-prolyl cis-trans isomerase SurA